MWHLIVSQSKFSSSSELSAVSDLLMSLSAGKPWMTLLFVFHNLVCHLCLSHLHCLSLSVCKLDHFFCFKEIKNPPSLRFNPSDILSADINNKIKRYFDCIEKKPTNAFNQNIFVFTEESNTGLEMMTELLKVKLSFIILFLIYRNRKQFTGRFPFKNVALWQIL